MLPIVNQYLEEIKMSLTYIKDKHGLGIKCDMLLAG